MPRVALDVVVGEDPQQTMLVVFVDVENPTKRQVLQAWQSLVGNNQGTKWSWHVRAKCGSPKEWEERVGSDHVWVDVCDDDDVVPRFQGRHQVKLVWLGASEPPRARGTVDDDLIM